MARALDRLGGRLLETLEERAIKGVLVHRTYKDGNVTSEKYQYSDRLFERLLLRHIKEYRAGTTQDHEDSAREVNVMNTTPKQRALMRRLADEV